jgi:hypothetical protein
MKIKLTQLEQLSAEETFYVIGGQVNPDKKKERKARRAERKQKRAERKASRRVSSDTTDTSKNDSFKI